MNICVLSGSPKGQCSVTIQTVLFLEKKFPDDNFEILHVGKQIRTYEKDFSLARVSLEKADLILFCYPVYTFMAPSQLHRFIELIFENKVDLSGKYGAQFSTSKHFFDTTAHAYISANCKDLGLTYAGGLSADMEDLTTQKGQDEALNFWKLVHFRMENGLGEDLVSFGDNNLDTHDHIKNVVTSKPVILGEKTQVLGDKAGSVCIVTDLVAEDTKLNELINEFKNTYTGLVKVVNLRDVRMDGGCLGCLNCALSGKCVYKDNFDDFLRNEIQSYDSFMYAFTIKNHSMGSLMKKYDDRQFCNGHRTVTMGKPCAYIINGDLSRESNLRMVIDGRAQVGGNFLAGIATSKEEIPGLCKNLAFAIENKITLPKTFLGVGGIRIFRDLIWLMAGLMPADYKFFKKHGFFDFPQKRWKTRIAMKLVGKLVNNKKVKAKMGNAMTEGMLMPYKKVLQKL